MTEITIQKIKAITGQFDPDIIYKLSLSNAGLSSIPKSVSLCPNLTVLDVSFNSLTSVDNLASLKYLKTLILFSNKVEKLDGFENLIPLEQLYLQKNKVKFMTEINHLGGLPNLKVLSLQSLSTEDRNPVCEMSPTLYRDTIMQKIPQLQVLDEVRTTPTADEFYSAVRDTFDLEPEMFIHDEFLNWSKEFPWQDKPIHVKVQLNSVAFKESVVECNDALKRADKELQKVRGILNEKRARLEDSNNSTGPEDNGQI